MYHLGQQFPSIYFTEREAECMNLMLQSNTANRIAEVLHISKRTVEYYILNMKLKLNCRTKEELVRIVRESSFMENYLAKRLR